MEDREPRPDLHLGDARSPYTMNMKKVESTVTNHRRPVLNRDALINPEVFDHFEKILPELEKWSDPRGEFDGGASSWAPSWALGHEMNRRRDVWRPSKCFR